MTLTDVLEKYKGGDIELTKALQLLSDKGLDDMGFATIDTNREERTGIPEVIYAAGKNTEQVKQIAERMYTQGIDVLATRVTDEMFDAIKKVIPEASYNSLAKTIAYRHQITTNPKGYIAIVAAGTSDIPIAEEAAETARFLGNEVKTIYDVGVAGIHRLFNKLDIIRQARVIIVIAGMEGALASVIGGLVSKPIIGVPTSIGYGANFQGLSALLAMLNSCSNGVTVTNIDNGFGAACQASQINKL